MEERVCIILVNYNTGKYCIDCIESLNKINYQQYEVVIVDNKSKDEDIKLIEDYIIDNYKCKLIKAEKNGGFAYGNNIGIQYAIKNNFKYALLLNADTEVDKDFLNHLIDNITEDSNIGIAIGKIMYFYDKNKIWYGGGEIKWNNYTGLHFGENQQDIGQCDKEQYITFATGCEMLINLSMDIDLNLSEEYFMYYEDVDYCAKVLDRGYKIKYIPKSVIYHKVGASGGGEASPFTLRWSNRGRFIFMNKYRDKSSKVNFKVKKYKFYITRFIKSGILYIKGEKVKSKELIRGMMDGIEYYKNDK